MRIIGRGEGERLVGVKLGVEDQRGPRRRAAGSKDAREVQLRARVRLVLHERVVDDAAVRLINYRIF